MKLWHDDVRPQPEGWVWARTNDAAKQILQDEHVEEISLDHDLGYDGPPPGECQKCVGLGKVCGCIAGTKPVLNCWNCDGMVHPCPECDGDGFIGGDVLYIAGTAEETGYDLVRWMVEFDYVPAKVTIHSWNPDGARKMAALLRDHGHKCEVAPYEIGPLGGQMDATTRAALGFEV